MDTSGAQSSVNTTVGTRRYPSQIKYILGNEACERYSYYGMRSILTVFFVQFLLLDGNIATSRYHFFVALCYLFPLLGGFVADKFWGKYKTILSLSIVYCIGHLYLALFETQEIGFYTGLGLIALGAGGIKPCVSAHVGDQFKKGEEGKVQKIFEIFYFMINFGSLFSTVLTPWTLEIYGPAIAFGIPGILMALATFVFWLGRNEYVHVPPSEKTPVGFNTLFWMGIVATLAIPWVYGAMGGVTFGADNSFLFPAVILGIAVIYGMIKGKSENGPLPIIVSAIKNFSHRKPSKGIFSGALKDYKEEDLDGVNAVLGVGTVFLMITFFWALYDQHGSTWILQGQDMDLNFMGRTVLPSQIAALNPFLVMSLIPIFSLGLYPYITRNFFEMTPLRRMTIGMFLTGFSFILVAIIQAYLDAGDKINIAWQFFPYLTITAAEVMISITGLEFAYTQAPRSMKSTIMSLWMLTVFAGNLFTSYIAATFSSLVNFAKTSLGSTGSDAFLFFVFFSIVMFVAAFVFSLIARKYKMRNFMES
jgi:POT family proton-dependent oligopeptide transporter